MNSCLPYYRIVNSVALGLLAVIGVALGSEPLRLHPDNSHYFLFRGRPILLITSGEHYGAVLNLDFDYRKYLRTLGKDGLNLTRIFTGSYVEPSGAFNIERNTLAPIAGRFLAPWARSEVPGYPNGGTKFDLGRWDEAYFRRLGDFVAEAGRCGVVVEVNLFCPFYEDGQWRLSPQNAANNVNGIGDVARTNVYTLDRHGGLLPVHEALTRKIVTELNRHDNVFYELCNEPYFGGVTLAWQHRIAEVILQTEQTLPRRHLISRNVANGAARVDDPHPGISIFNFHYAYPPDAVALNDGLNRVVGDNETGFRGTNDEPYRVEAWNFILAGGALFNHLDYSFVVGHEDGTFVYPAKQPGGGNPVLRRQFRALSEFIHDLDFLRMRPVTDAADPGRGRMMRVLADIGRSYAVYVGPDLRGKKEDRAAQPGSREPLTKVALEVPAGRYRVEWLDPVSGRRIGRETVEHPGGHWSLKPPLALGEVALKVVRQGVSG